MGLGEGMGEIMAFQGNLFSKLHFNGQYLGFANGSSKIKADRTITLFSPSQGVKRRGCWKIFKISHPRRFLTQFIPISEGVLSFLFMHPPFARHICLLSPLSPNSFSQKNQFQRSHNWIRFIFFDNDEKECKA